MGRRVAVVAFGLLVSAFSLAATDFSKLNDSVVLLYKQTGNGSMRFVCSGTVFENVGAESRILTAAHCLMREGSDGKPAYDRSPVYVTLDDPDEKVYVKTTEEGYGTTQSGNDVAILRAKLPRKVPAIQMGDESTEHPGSPVLYVGSPYGLGKLLVLGTICAVKVDRPIIDEARSMNLSGDMCLQVASAGGASGSAVVSQSTGKIIGVLVAGDGVFVFAVPISRVTEILKMLKKADAK